MALKFAGPEELEAALKDSNLVRGELVTEESRGDDMRRYIETIVKVDADWVVEYLVERWNGAYADRYDDPSAAYLIGWIEGMDAGRRL